MITLTTPLKTAVEESGGVLTEVNCPLSCPPGHSVQEVAKSSGFNFISLSLPVFDRVETKAAFRNNAKQDSNAAVG
jgi:hypothetical protein